MTKETTIPAGQSELSKFWSVPTLEYIENDVFFKNDIEQVEKDTDLAFIELLRNEVSDDIDTRNNVLNSWFAVKKTLAVIRLKELPENIFVLEINFDL